MTEEEMLDELEEALADGVDGFTEWEELFIWEMVDWIADNEELTGPQREKVEQIWNERL
jgi:hypothetical protein